MEPERPAIPPSPKPVGVIEQLPQEHYKASSPPVALWSASSRDVQDLFSYVIINYFVFALLNTSNGLVNHLLMGLGMPAINWYASPQYWPVILTLVNLWKNAGFWNYPVDLPGDQVTANWRAGQYAMEIDVVHRDSLGQLKQTYGYDFVAKGLGPLILTTSGIIATMNNISSTSKNPQAAMKVIEAFNNDLDVYHLICRGVEGKHYVVTDQKNNVIGFPTGVTASNDRYNPQSS